MSLRAVFIALLCIAAATGHAQTAPASAVEETEEPTYTARFVDKQMARLYIAVTKSEFGKVVRIGNRPYPVKSDLQFDARVDVDSTNAPQHARARFGKMPSLAEPYPYQTDLEADTIAAGNWVVRTPAQKGVVPYIGKLITMPAALLFLGKQVNLNGKVPQNFSILMDYNTPQTRVFPVTFTPDGIETITLKTGAVRAHRILYAAPFAPHLPKKQQNGAIFVGDGGEILLAENALFNNPITARGTAVLDDDGNRRVYYDPADYQAVAVPMAGGGFEVKVGVGKPLYTLASATVSRALLPTESVTPWLGRKQTNHISANEIRWEAEAGAYTDSKVTDAQVWFVPYWFVTDIWEGATVPNALAPDSEREGTYMPLFTGQRTGNKFTLRRLTDRGKTDDGKPVHRYRFTSKNVYDLYTDGSRLIAFIGSDGTTIIRDGQEEFAARLPKPLPPKPPTP